MKNRAIRLGSEAIWVFGGQAGVALGGLLGVKLLTHLLSPHEFGRFSIANTIVLLIGVNVFGPMGQGLMRYWTIPLNRDDLADYIAISDRYIKRLFFCSVLLSFLVGLAIFISRQRAWTGVIGLAMICGAFTGWAGIRLSILMAARKRKTVSVINVLTAFAKPVIAAVLIMSVTVNADVAVTGFAIVACLSAIFTEIHFRKTAESRLSELKSEIDNYHENQLGRSIVSFSAPFFIWSFFAWAHQSCDRWALLTFQGADTVGAYAVIAQLAFYPLVFGSGFLSNFFIPIAYERAGGLQSQAAVNAGSKVLVAMVSLYLAGAVLLILIFYFFHRQLVLFISDEKYAEFSYLLPMLTGAWSFYYFGQVLSGFGLLVNKPNVYIMPILFSGIVATLATFFLSFKFGIVGVIWALGITGLFYAAWCMLIAKRLINPNAA